MIRIGGVEMYAHQEERNIEEKCYDFTHVEKVLEKIRVKFDEYFNIFITSEAGKVVTAEDVRKIAGNLGVKNVIINDKVNQRVKFSNIIKDSISSFEHDRNKYQEIFDDESLNEYDDDPQYFKSTVLRNECPIIHSTLQNKRAKELDKYRFEFNISDPNDLLLVVHNLHNFAEEYYNENYDQETYDQIDNYKDLGYGTLDTDDFTVYGVIGGGIKTHMLYKVYPAVFPNRSRDAIWALWYLTSKDTFGCIQDSEFLMIDVQKSITQQNYFYPYELFAYYAHQVFQMLKEKANSYEVYLDPEYRYVFVDSFLVYVAQLHDKEISVLRQQLRDGGIDYA
jgi:hypothetical protein